MERCHVTTRQILTFLLSLDHLAEIFGPRFHNLWTTSPWLDNSINSLMTQNAQ
ncbi:unnamed protein product [Acidithrix sp. C25]|nr:unnamed protein product [Acidithrix sp. C25]